MESGVPDKANGVLNVTSVARPDRQKLMLMRCVTSACPPHEWLYELLREHSQERC